MKQKNLFKFIFYTLTILLTFTYIIYRIFFTIPTTLGIIALISSILVLFIEIWESLDFFAYYLNILCVKKTSPKIPDLSNITQYPDIDVLIATINEHESLLKNTITACKNMSYPDKSKIHIYICDDGNRANIKKLAENLGVNYLSRITNKNAKAGNYNHALNHITSPFVATFDADMAPTPNFLLTTLPFFFTGTDEIGFVQLPQSFNNPDIFQLRFKLENKIPFEQDYFYHSIQIAKNATNSAIYCGTNALFSRKALNSCNGFAIGTISEDIATGMMIESKGYKCLALNNVEAYGTAVNDLSGFVKQRSRWARGCVQILKKYNILKNKGLSFKQKIEYLSCISYWFFGVRRMVYLLTPLLFSIFGVIIVDCNLTTFISIWLPTYILKRFTLDIFEGNKRSSTWNKIYETILTPVLCKEVLKEFFGFGNTKFEVTPKSSQNLKMSKTNKQLLISHLVLLILNILGLIMCLFRIKTSGITVYILSLLWIISNIFYLTISVIFDSSVKCTASANFIPNKISVYKKLSVLGIFFNRNKLSKNTNTIKKKTK
nr:glycosyltransferase [Clostridia bacterium]